jgi:hypothetical protein
MTGLLSRRCTGRRPGFGRFDRERVAAGDPHRAGRVRECHHPVGAGFVDSFGDGGAEAVIGGDGSGTNSFSHTYSAAGSYTATLVGGDADGGTLIGICLINVQ